MALKIRRGTDLQRQSITPSEGELLYTIDTKKLFVGDGSTQGGTKVAPVSTADLVEDSGYKFFTDERAQDATAALFTSSSTVSTTHTNITFAYNDAAQKIVATVPYYGAVNSAQANSIAVYSATGTTISGTENIKFDDAGNQLLLTNSSVVMTAANSGRSFINLQTNSSGTNPNFVGFQRSRGTSGSPTAVAPLDSFGGIAFGGHDGSTYTAGASVFAYVPSGFSVSTGIVPTALNINLQGTDGTSQTRFRVFPDGRSIIGPLATTDTGTGILVVNGTAAYTGTFSSAAIQSRSYLTGNTGQRAAFTRLRGTIAAPSAVGSADELFGFTFNGYDGTNNKVAASILSVVDGSVTTGKVPGRLELATTSSQGVTTTWTTLDSTGSLIHTGALKTTGLIVQPPNYVTVAAASFTINTNAITTVGSAILNFASTTNVSVGMSVTGVNIPANSFVVAVTSTTATINQNIVTQVASATGITFGATYYLSATITRNIIIPSTTGLTATVNMPSGAADGQVCELVIAANAITLALGNGTLSTTFAGSGIAVASVFKYVYRVSNTTWYKI